ncbi:hypothetical protein EJ03DRAFT_330913 [Teratosphaeria nubilosa]|uniref:HMG box domain-containing protein n=1 Tax=Teratosphaeria nubilosa TaxID=161662 RepID=A0A6G1KXX4_9PEZI|nr:hypothetical protein EJ03DRAFT_330913 [Teratosphaeria nubilosa]
MAQQQQNHNFNNFAYEVPPYFGGDQLVQGTPQYTAPYADMAPAGKKSVSIDVDQFIRTRDALSSAYMSLSSSIDKAVKAYIDHTNVVLAGDSSLNVSHLTQPFDQLASTAQLAQQALHAGGAAPQQAQQNGAPAPQAGETGADGKPAKRMKRAYKQRDPNAPKRPLTAYFRYLQEQRGPLAAQLAEKAGGTPQKPGDLSKEATERWNKLSKEEQQPYRDAYQRALKDYEKEVAIYKANGGKVDDAAAKVDGAAVEGVDAEAENDDDDDGDDDDDDSSDDSSDDSDEDEEEAPAPPPPAKTPKPSKKNTQQAIPQFSSLETPAPAFAGSSSPERKRKAAAETPGTVETGKKKKKQKKTITAGEDAPTPAAAPTAQMTPCESSKKKEKKKKRKSEA